MSLAVPPTRPVSESTDVTGPLAVAGTVHGRLVEVLVATLGDVLTRISMWTEQDPSAIGCWGLRADYSVPLTLPLRHKVGTVRETCRTTHLVRLMPGEPHGSYVAALCGERLTIVGVDVLPVGGGMPCSACLAGGLAGDRPQARRVVDSGPATPAVQA